MSSHPYAPTSPVSTEAPGVFDGTVSGHWLVLAALTVAFSVVTVHVVDRRALAGRSGRAAH